jgi:processive 1,2-diacylglycerol beta-glucosyltransferase
MANQDDVELVTVFETADAALLPLATATLEQAAIDYGFRNARDQFPVVFGHPPAFVDVEGSVEVVVRASDAARARELLTDLETPVDGAPAVAAPPVSIKAAPAAGGIKSVALTDTGTGRIAGRITDEQLQFLVDELEEESSEDQDYYFDAATVDLLASAGADADLLELLRRVIAGREGVELRWTRES